MRKLIGFIKTKEKEDKVSISEKKTTVKTKKLQAPPSTEQNNNEPRDLFWDGYSDIGYC